jgi:hypothetical protein
MFEQCALAVLAGQKDQGYTDSPRVKTLCTAAFKKDASKMG